jgi:RNA polymerase sigma-70 factor (ECF subfamily)
LEALDDLLSRHGPEIKAVAFMVVRDAGIAEEVTLDTVLMAWQKVGSLRDPERMRPWLLRIATRMALRRRRRFPRLTPVSLEVAGSVADQPSSVIDRIALAEALDHLPPRMRAVVALHYVAGLTVPEIALSVGRSRNTVKTQLREALARMRGELESREPAGREPENRS